MAGRFSQYAIDVVTDSGGDAVAFLPTAAEKSRASLSGEVYAIIYTKGDYADGVVFAITAERSGLTIWSESDVNASKTVFPRVAASDTTGVPSGVIGVVPPLANERLSIVISNGGNEKAGNFNLILG